MFLFDSNNKSFRDAMRQLSKIAKDNQDAALRRIAENPASAIEWGAANDVIQAEFHAKQAGDVLSAKPDLSDDILRMHVVGNCLQALMNLGISSSSSANNVRYQESMAAAELLRSLGLGYSYHGMARRLVEGSKVVDAADAAKRKATVWEARIEKVAHRHWRIVQYNPDGEQLSIIGNLPSSELAQRRWASLNINPPGGLWVYSPARNDFVRK